MDAMYIEILLYSPDIQIERDNHSYYEQSLIKCNKLIFISLQPNILFAHFYWASIIKYPFTKYIDDLEV